MGMRLLAKFAYKISIVSNIGLYIASILDFYLYNRYLNNKVSIEIAGCFILFKVVICLMYMFLSVIVNEYHTPYHKKYIKKCRIIYFSYLILPITKYSLLIICRESKYCFPIYLTVWAVLFMISMYTIISMYIDFTANVIRNVSLCEKLEEEYVVNLTDEEISNLQKERETAKRVSIIAIVSRVFGSLYLKNYLCLIIFMIVFFLINYKVCLNTLYPQNKKERIVLFLLLVFESLSSMMEYVLVVNGIIAVDDNNIRNLLFVVFIIPIIWWLNRNYKKNSRYKFEELSRKRIF